MVSENKFGYKNKDVVISIFNESQRNFKKYTELFDDNREAGQKALNIAGNRLQQSFELGVKHYLHHRYKALCTEGKMKLAQMEELSNILETGRVKGKMADAKYLMSQLKRYAEPPATRSGIKFDVIKANANNISNDNKHKGNDVDRDKFEESLTEIRKFILQYIDNNAKIQLTVATEYINLQKECDYWTIDTNYNYCLICDRFELDDSALRKILYINWSLIIDFDVLTGSRGLLKAYVDEYGIEPNSFNVINPRGTFFDVASNMPYWFHINGLDDIKESVADTDRRWNQKYGSILFECMCRYREAFSKPLKVIVLGGDEKKIEKYCRYLMLFTKIIYEYFFCLTRQNLKDCERHIVRYCGIIR